MLKLQENWKKKKKKERDNDVDADVAQLKCSNNKCYTSVFRNIQINDIIVYF